MKNGTSSQSSLFPNLQRMHSFTLPTNVSFKQCPALVADEPMRTG